MEINVAEASRRLGVNDSRVRQLLRAGELRGRRLGGSWLIPVEEVARRERSEHRSGRPLAPKRAWAVLDLLDGGRAAWLSDPARSQVRRYLADLDGPGADGWRAALRRRSRVLEVAAHPAAIERLRRVDGVQQTGLAAVVGRGFDVVDLAESIPELYVAAESWPDLSRSLALHEAAGPNVRIRLPNEIWPFVAPEPLGRPVVGDAVLAADLLEADEPRVVAAGAARLDELLGSWLCERGT